MSNIYLDNQTKKTFPLIVRSVEQGAKFTSKYDSAFTDKMLRWVYALLRPLMALRAWLHKITFGVLDRSRLPLLRLALIAVTILVLSKRDFNINFTISNSLAAAPTQYTPPSSEISHTQYSEYAPAKIEDLKAGDTEQFVERYKKVAQAEMKRYKIPASIKMAQAIIESRSGTSTLATKNNNYFGIKCFSKKCEKGHCSNHNDDHHKDFFRIFKSPWESWRAHSIFLSKKERYAHLFKYGKDYKKWAVGLRKAGYATDPNYDKKLISIIEKYNLHKLDK